jgi:hypothetical protein
MSEDDPYADLKQHRLTPEKLAQLAVVPGQIKRRRRQFVMVPWIWIEKLGTARYVATYRVALHVLYRHWRGRGEPSRCPTAWWRLKAFHDGRNGVDCESSSGLG